MKIQTECLPCLLKRMVFETELSTTDANKRIKALRTACAMLAKLYDPAVCSATIATQVHQAVYEALGNKDPYKTLKQRSNQIAATLVPRVEQLIKIAGDPLKASMQCAIIGNIMDFGIDGASAHPEMLQEVFEQLYAEGLGHDDYETLKALLRDATSVVLFTDNCGEIVFDKLLCRELKVFNPGLHLTVVVKGEPILSDATMQDAADIRLGEVADELLTTGCFAVGVDFARLPRQVIDALERANVIIAKGMANYESFSETSYRPVAYLLRTKCAAIARSMGLPRDISAIQLVP
ncbi:MAG: ARMT1-like domain-containing protein [Candidatus Thermoplasmatota archaeon]